MTLKADFHVHDPKVSWDSNSTRENMVDKYVSNGYDIVGFVGHDKMADVHSDNLIIFNGIEHTISKFPEIHVIEFPSHDMTILCHPRRMFNINIVSNAKKFMDRNDIDIVEKYNGGRVQYVRSMDAVELASSDAHNVRQVKSSYTMVDASRDKDDIANSVKNGDVDAVKGRNKPVGRMVKTYHGMHNIRGGIKYITNAVTSVESE